jgi:hypothetical protein
MASIFTAYFPLLPDLPNDRVATFSSIPAQPGQTNRSGIRAAIFFFFYLAGRSPTRPRVRASRSRVHFIVKRGSHVLAAVSA